MTAGLQLRDALTVDVRDTLEALSVRFGTVYRVSYGDGRWQASRRDGTGGTLRGRTPDDLTAAMRAGTSR